MTDTRDWADEKATADVTRWFHDNGFPCDGNDLPALERLYAASLRAAARVQPGHVREGDTQADAELGRMVRAIYHSGKVLSMSPGIGRSPFVMVGGVLQQGTYDTLDEAVRKAWEAK